MFGRRPSRAERVRHDARSIAQRGLERGRHRAEALRDALPEPGDVMTELREQAEPVLKAAREQAEPALKSAREQAEPMLKAAREQAEKAPIPQRKQSRSKKPFLLLGLLVIGAVVAYLIFSRRDQEPAYLMEEPDEPQDSPAQQPSPGMSQNGSAPDSTPSGMPSTVNGEDVPERASAQMASEPAQPTQASSSAPAPASNPYASTNAPGSGPNSMSYQPRAQVAAWDLPPSSIPPMRGGSASNGL